MKKLFFSFVFAILLLGIFAAAQEISISQEVNAAVETVGSDLSEKVKPEVAGFVQDFVSKNGVDPHDITDINQVDFNALPKEVNIENVGDHNLAIYQVNYTNNADKNKSVYIVSYAVEKLASQGDIIVSQDKREFLNFGHAGGTSASDFLDTATGVKTSLNKGYVMTRKGSITSISTNLEVVQSGEGVVEIIVYKNGEPINFGNTFDATSIGIKKDYDVQSKGVVRFEAGDVISAYVKSTDANSETSWTDVITLVEITTEN